MSSQYCVGRSRLEVADPSSSSSHFSPKGDTRTFSVRLEDDSQKCYREVSVNQLSRKTLLSGEERLIGEKGDPRPVAPELVHTVRQVQDDDCSASADPASPWGLHLLYRSFRRVLACSRGGEVSKFPGFLPWEKALQVQGDALRPQCSSQNLHKAGQLSGEDSAHARDTDCCIPGRLAHLGQQSQALPRSAGGDNVVTPKPGLSHQPEKISVNTTESFCLVGPQVGSEITHSQHPLTKEKISSIYGQTSAAFSFDDEKEARVRSWLSSVPLGCNPHSQDQTQGFPKSLAGKSQERVKGQTLSSAENLPEILKPWSQISPFNKAVRLAPPPVSVTIHTNASKSGWGALGSL